MARLIFCFFAEDTDIFYSEYQCDVLYLGQKEALDLLEGFGKLAGPLCGHDDLRQALAFSR